MPPKKGAKKAKAKKDEKKVNSVEEQQKERDHDLETEDDRAETKSTEPQSNGVENSGKGKKLARQLTYSEILKDLEQERLKNTDRLQKIADVSDEEKLDVSHDDGNQVNESHVSDTSANDDSGTENEESDASQIASQEENQTDDADTASEDESESEVEAAPVKRGARGAGGKSKPVDNNDDPVDDEPRKKRLPAKEKSKAIPQPEKAKDMPNLSADSETEADETDGSSPPKKAKPGKAVSKPTKAPAAAAPVSVPSKGKKEAKQKGKSEEESIFDIPSKSRSKKKANQDDQEDDKPPTKAAPTKKATATKPLAKPVPRSKKGATVTSDDEEEKDDPPPKGGKTTKKQLVTSKKDEKENDPPKQKPTMGISNSAPRKVGGQMRAGAIRAPGTGGIKKAPAKSKGKANAEEVSDEEDASAALEKSLHINLPTKATIVQKITEAVKLLAGKHEKCSLKEVVAFLQKENQFDVNKNDEKIRKQVKQMFEDKVIVPYNKNVTRTTLGIAFKLGAINKKSKVSSEKRKSIAIAAKVKGRTKKTQRMSIAGKAPRKKLTKAKKTTVDDESELEQFDDDKDVPPSHR